MVRHRVTWKPSDIVRATGERAEPVAAAAATPVASPSIPPPPDKAGAEQRMGKKRGAAVGGRRPQAPPQPRRGRGQRKDEDAEVDFFVGQRVRIRRTLLDISQPDLARRLGISFQQVQKYEKGHNRLSAGMLMRLSHVLDVPIGYFFDGAPVPGQVGGSEPMASVPGPLMTHDALEVAQAYADIRDADLRRQTLAFVRAAANIGADDGLRSRGAER